MTVQRAIIQPGLMRVSFPGIEVTTADIDQTVFDSRWSGVAPYLKGTLDSANDGAAIQYFGETLPSPPLAFCYFRSLNAGVPTTTFGNSPTMFRGNGTNNWWYVEVGTTAIQFRSLFGSQVSRLYYTLYKKVAG